MINEILSVLKPIKNDREHKKALRVVEKYFDKDRQTKIGSLIGVLVLLIEQYEDERFPIGKPNPIEAIKFRMDQLHWSQTDLANFLGSRSRASELLNRKRKLSIETIRLLHEKLNIPAEVLIGA